MNKQMKKVSLLLMLCMVFVLSVHKISTTAWAGQQSSWDGTITIVQSSDVIGFDPTASTDTNNKDRKSVV